MGNKKGRQRGKVKSKGTEEKEIVKEEENASHKNRPIYELTYNFLYEQVMCQL
jgi:hypothetical protein